MTAEADELLYATINALARMAPSQRAKCATALIDAVQGPQRPIAAIRWAAIAQMRDAGMQPEQIAAELGTSVGAVDLAVQTHQRTTRSPSDHAALQE